MNEKSQKAVKSIGRSISNINKQIDILRTEFPEAMMYVEDGVNYIVMKGPSHKDDWGSEAIRDNEIDSFTVPHSDCGAW